MTSSWQINNCDESSSPMIITNTISHLSNNSTVFASSGISIDRELRPKKCSRNFKEQFDMKVCNCRQWTQNVHCAVINLLDIVQTSILTIRASRIFPWRRPAQLNRISPPRVGDGLSSGTHWHTTVDMAIKPSRLRACSFWKFKQVITLPFILLLISFLLDQCGGVIDPSVYSHCDGIWHCPDSSGWLRQIVVVLANA